MKALTLAELKLFLGIQIACLSLATILALTTFTSYSNYYYSHLAALAFLIMAGVLLTGSITYLFTRRLLNRLWVEIGIIFYTLLGTSMAILFVLFS